MATNQQTLNQALSNFRKTAAGKQLGTALFTGKGLNPAQITALLVKAGIPVPKGVQVTADVAQVIMAGGAIVSNINKGASLGSFVGSAGGVIQATTQLLEITGLLDPNSPAAQILTVGSDVAMIMASGGLDVLADLKFVLDVVNIVSAWQGQAKADAQKALAQYISNREAPQMTAAASLFAQYNNGNMSVFQLMGNVAEEAPDLFLTYFPQLKGFMPTYSWTVSETANDTSWWGDHNSYTASQTFTSISTDLKNIQTGIMAKYVGVPLSGFLNIFLASQNGQMQQGESRELLDPTTFGNLLKYGFPKTPSGKYVIQPHNTPLPRISLQALCALSLMPPYIQRFRVDFNIGELLQSLNLTPFDFGDNVLENGVQNRDYFPDVPSIPGTPAITMNGVDYFSPSQQQTYAQNIALQAVQTQTQKNILHWDETGWISTLMKDPIGSKMIQEWGLLPRVTPAQVNQPDWYKSMGMSVDPMNVIDMSQYWSALAMLDQIAKDPFFASFQGQLSQFNWQGTVDTVSSLHKTLLFKSNCRKMNIMALSNIASYLNTTPQNLKLLNVGGSQGTVFTTKN